MVNLGFLAALGAALAWGSYMVPFKKSHCTNFFQFQALMALGVFLSGLAVSLLTGFPLSINTYGLISGMLWTIGNAISLTAISNLGMAKAVPLMSSLVILSSFLLGALVFHELPSGLTVGFIAIGLIVIGIIIVSSTGDAKSKSVRKGVAAGILAGLVFSSYLIPIKISNLAIRDFFFSACVGILITGLLIALISRTKFTKEAIKEGLFSGIIWNIGNLLSLISLAAIGLSKMGPISQSSILVAVLWGLFYFKEISKFSLRVRILMGAIVLFAGIITLSFA